MELNESIQDRIIIETLKLGSIASAEEDPIKISKISSALSILNIASNVSSTEQNKASKLLNLAKNIVK